MKENNWLTPRQFAVAYVKRWKLPKTPAQKTLNNWFQAFKKNRLARLEKNPFVASGKTWSISPDALDIAPPRVGAPVKEKKADAAKTAS